MLQFRVKGLWVLNMPIKTEVNKRFEQMKQEAVNWKDGWKDLSTYIDPTRGIFDGDRTKIGKTIDHKTLLDGHASRAKRITSSGMQTGMTDPSRPWFKLTLENIVIDNIPGLRSWVDEVTRRMIDVMNKSNIYRVFLNCYDELVTFGTGCFIILEDFDDVIRGRSFTIGEYYLGTDNKGRVNAFGRDFEMEVGQMALEFGKESLSAQARAYLESNPKTKIKIRHLIEPNNERVPGYEDFLNMPYRSLYWEAGNGDERFLAQRGFKVFPVVAPRWDSITTDMTYGYGPGWHALGDIKQLQATVKDKLLAQEKAHNPPVIEDENVIGHSNRLPGGVTKISGNVPNTGVRPAYQVNPVIEAFEMAIENLYRKIDSHMFADLFLMISNIQDGQQTAFEIAKREQEKMMMLGPILHGLNEEMHAPAIDLVFSYMNDAGLIPPPPQLPEELKGAELKVQYISILAQAQRAMGVQQIQQTVGYISSLAQAGRTDAWDVLDVDKSIKDVNDLNGAPADIILDPDQVQAIREQRAQQQNQMVAMEAAERAAKTGKDLSQSSVGQGSMLDVVGEAVKGLR